MSLMVISHTKTLPYMTYKKSQRKLTVSREEAVTHYIIIDEQ